MRKYFDAEAYLKTNLKKTSKYHSMSMDKSFILDNDDIKFLNSVDERISARDPKNILSKEIKNKKTLQTVKDYNSNFKMPQNTLSFVGMLKRKRRIKSRMVDLEKYLRFLEVKNIFGFNFIGIIDRLKSDLEVFENKKKEGCSPNQSTSNLSAIKKESYYDKVFNLYLIDFMSNPDLYESEIHFREEAEFLNQKRDKYGSSMVN